ncbi:NAC domain-containing protein 48 [Setaria italica]|nr:NAC domain-containing protein 48 [Setaria italica]
MSSMSSSVPEILGLPPGVQFRPDDDELVEFYLLPRARGEPAPFPSVTIIDDDAAGITLPWDLLERHGRGGDDEAYFFVRGSADGEARKPGARQERGCGGGGKWVSQKRHVPDDKRVTAGEKVHWSMHNLNLHMGRGGSVGWVMHEYVLTDSSFPSVKICHVSFTGHGKNRKRMPGSAVDGQSESAPMMKRARVAATATAGGSSSSGSAGSTTTTADQDSGVGCTSGPAPQAAFTGEGISEWVPELCRDDLQGIPLAASAADAATEQLVPEHVMMPMVQESAGMAELEHQYLCGGDEGQQEFVAPMGITLDGFGGASGFGDMDAGAQPAFVNWGGVQFY